MISLVFFTMMKAHDSDIETVLESVDVVEDDDEEEVDKMKAL